MGVLLLWRRPEADSSWDYTDIYRSDSESGTYTLIQSNSISDISYYDDEGTSSNWYKIKFRKSDGSESEFSDAMEGNIKNLYCNPEDAVRQAGLDPDDLPDPLTMNDVYEMVYDVSRTIDDFRKTVYGRQETFSNDLYSSRYIDLQGHLNLERRNIVDDDTFKIEFKSGTSDWVEKQPYYDYDVDFPKGRVHFYVQFILAMRSYNNIRVSGTYGDLTIPDTVKKIAKYLGAIKILVYLTNGSFDNVSTFSMGSANWSIGQAYVNLKEAWDMSKMELDREMKAAGWGDGKKKRMRIA